MIKPDALGSFTKDKKVIKPELMLLVHSQRTKGDKARRSVFIYRRQKGDKVRRSLFIYRRQKGDKARRSLFIHRRQKGDKIITDALGSFTEDKR